MTPELEPTTEEAPAGSDGRDDVLDALGPDRTIPLVVAMIVCSALLAVIVGLGLRPRSTEAAVVDTGSAPAALDVASTTTTEPPTTTTTTEPPTTTAPETTTTTAPPTTLPPVSVPTGGGGPPPPPRPFVSYTATSALDAFPRAKGMIGLAANPGGPVDISFSNPRLVNNNPAAPVDLVFLVKRDLGEWLEVYVPARPNGRTAYIRRSEVELRVNPFRIEIYLQEFRIIVYEGTNVKLDTKIGVAKSSTPTPVGVFYDTELVRPPNPGGPYGPYAFGLSGFSDVFYSFGGGPGQIGMHGTNQPWAVGRQISSGCIRLLNKDITYLASFIPLGTPIIINDRRP